MVCLLKSSSQRRRSAARMRLCSPRKSVRIALVGAMILFAVLNFHLIPSDYPNDEQIPSFSVRGGGVVHGDHNNHVQLGNLTPNNKQASNEPKLPDIVRSVHPKIVIMAGSNNSQGSIGGPSLQLNISDIKQIKADIERINREQYVHNLDKFGVVLGPESIVFVVQVHDRIDHLQHLINSLSKVRGIENILLIFSHDLFSHQINEVVTSITFCPILQIFFPYSQQIYYDRFPGEDKNDCPRNMKKEEAMQKKCNNAEHPDKYGHYREFKYCQTKHHWIWKLRFVFEEVRLLDGYEGQMLLLEDDYYVSEDVLFALQMMQNVKEKDCPDCRMLVLGNYDKNQNFKEHGGKVERAYWISSKHNMGMAFTRSFWADIKKCGKEFCQHDDYNWDWTLQHLSMKCVPEKVRLLKMKAARVFHVGECGMHTKSKNCNPDVKVQQVENILSQNKQYLFPNTVSMDGDSHMKLRDPKANGGWGDIRDHNLCISILNNETFVAR